MMHGEAWGFTLMGPPALAVWLLLGLIVVFPFWRILPRAGLPAVLALLTVIPFMALVLLWVMALKRWPGDDAREV